MAPNEVNEKNQHLVYDYLYSGKGRYSKYVPKASHQGLRVGTHVRITREKFHFEHGYNANWSDEVFVVASIVHSNPLRYILKDMDGEVLEGSFYRAEVQPITVTERTYFKIDKILKHRGSGRSRELFVSWRGYPSKFNSWIRESELKK
jgi:hypothetical protein